MPARGKAFAPRRRRQWRGATRPGRWSSLTASTLWCKVLSIFIRFRLMAIPVTAHPSVPSDSDPKTGRSPERQLLARRILFETLFLGSLGDALLHDRFAIGLTLWMATLALIFVHATRQRGERLT